jgi:hypothetical protein
MAFDGIQYLCKYLFQMGSIIRNDYFRALPHLKKTKHSPEYHTEQWGNELSVWKTLNKDIQNIPEQWGNELSSLTAAGQQYILSTPSADLTSSTPINPPKALVHTGGRTMRAGAGG